jgi:septal ring factor EnvC (AmiA/AmiB activator)
LWLAGLAGGGVIAPFDGRIVYAGPFANLGLVLIIRHGAGYHSVFAGLGRIDGKVDQWLVAGEPVAAMPAATSPPSGDGSVLYFELRRDGQPVDPQPWLATGEDRRDQHGGDQKVSE